MDEIELERPKVRTPRQETRLWLKNAIASALESIDQSKAALKRYEDKCSGCKYWIQAESDRLQILQRALEIVGVDTPT